MIFPILMKQVLLVTNGTLVHRRTITASTSSNQATPRWVNIPPLSSPQRGRSIYQSVPSGLCLKIKCWMAKSFLGLETVSPSTVVQAGPSTILSPLYTVRPYTEVPIYISVVSVNQPSISTAISPEREAQLPSRQTWASAIRQ